MSTTTDNHDLEKPDTDLDLARDKVTVRSMGNIALVAPAHGVGKTEFIGAVRQLFSEGKLRPYDQLSCDVSVIPDAGRQKQFAESAQERALGSALYYLKQSMDDLADMEPDNLEFRVHYVLGNIIGVREVCQRVLARVLISSDELRMVVLNTLAECCKAQVSMPQAVLDDPIHEKSSNLTVIEMSLASVADLVMQASKLPSVTPSEITALMGAYERGVEHSSAEEDPRLPLNFSISCRI